MGWKVIILFVLSGSIITLISCTKIDTSQNKDISLAVWRTPTPSATSSSTSTRTPTPLIKPTPIVVGLPPPTLDPTAIHSFEVRVEEEPQFVNNHIISYLKSGNLYVHDLDTEISKLLVGGGDITSQDWSNQHELFAIAKDGRLLLVDKLGNIRRDLTSVLDDFDEHKSFICHAPHREEKQELIEKIDWVSWSPGGDYLSFACIISNEDRSVDYATYWIFEFSTEELNKVEGARFSPPAWLNDNVLMTEQYLGGGGYEFRIIDAKRDERIFTFSTLATIPVASRDGKRLAISGRDLKEVVIFDATSGETVLTEGFYPDMVHVDSWSDTDNYLAFYLQTTEGEKSTNRYTILNIATKELWEISQETRYSKIVWLQDIDEALVLGAQEDGNSVVSRLVPETKSVIPIGEIPKEYLWPAQYRNSDRYLVFTSYEPESSGFGAKSSGLWLQNDQIEEIPYQIYQVIPLDKGQSKIKNPILSLDDNWLIFTQYVGSDISSANPYFNDITLQAIHLPTGNQQQITKWGVSTE